LVEAIIEKLKEYNIINDEIYAETYAKNNPNFSRNKIKQKLMSVGVKSDVTELATVEVDDYASCLKQSEKYMRNKVADKQTIEKLIRRLQGMGYNWDAIKYSLNKLKFDMED
jgi:regulatory protein